ncbi:hypothetical protein [Nocardia sp. NPDC058497]|uniref:hypothetical protein n=1 Tax=Nocardia sp. NPDC058497 TaxID=3346529 RepID=UPI003645F99A
MTREVSAAPVTDPAAVEEFPLAAQLLRDGAAVDAPDRIVLPASSADSAADLDPAAPLPGADNEVGAGTGSPAHYLRDQATRSAYSRCSATYFSTYQQVGMIW